MTPFASNFTHLLSLSTIVLLLASIAALYTAYGKSARADSIRRSAGPYAFPVAFFIACAGTVGSLIYSEVIGFAPCSLCIIQRVFLYPQILIIGFSLWKPQYVRPLARLALILSCFGGAVALYHAYTQIGGSSLLPCTAAGGDCSKVFFVEWGFVTIPAMALAAFVGIFSFSLLSLRSHKALT